MCVPNRLQGRVHPDRWWALRHTKSPTGGPTRRADLPRCRRAICAVSQMDALLITAFRARMTSPPLSRTPTARPPSTRMSSTCDRSITLRRQRAGSTDFDTCDAPREGGKERPLERSGGATAPWQQRGTQTNAVVNHKKTGSAHMDGRGGPRQPWLLCFRLSKCGCLLPPIGGATGGTAEQEDAPPSAPLLDTPHQRIDHGHGSAPGELEVAVGPVPGEARGVEMRSKPWKVSRRRNIPPFSPSIADGQAPSSQRDAGRTRASSWGASKGSSAGLKPGTSGHGPFVEHEGDFGSDRAPGRQSRQQEAQQVQPVADELRSGGRISPPNAPLDPFADLLPWWSNAGYWAIQPQPPDSPGP